MDIRHRLYPYPVLSASTDDYIESSFSADLQVEKGIREIIFSIKLSLSNEKIQNLIDSGSAEYVIHIECPYTSYRMVIKTRDTEVTKNILENELNGKVSVCFFVIATTEILDYHNSCFNEEYEGMCFTIHKGNIIAIGGQVNIEITKEIEELSKIPSIFTICRYAEDTDESMKIDIGGEKIVITLCNNSFQNYKLLTNVPSMIPVFHSMIIIPALIYTFETIKSTGVEEYMEQRWYKSIEKTLSKHNIALCNETLENIPSYELSQKLLDLPIDRALNVLTTQDNSYEED